MGRRRQNRIIANLPSCQGFKPIGIPMTRSEAYALLIEEYEAIRLLDYEGLSQEDAALRMGISRPTLTRIYMKARKTIANSIVERKAFIIEGGDFELVDELIRCPSCRKMHAPLKEKERHCKKCKD